MKKGQFQISFGVIFSIILIISVIGVGIYVLVVVLDIGKCNVLANYYDDLRDEVDKAYRSTMYSGTFEEKVLDGTEKVCFGNVLSCPAGPFQEECMELRRIDTNHNVFLYPSPEGCEELRSIKIQNVEFENGFFCVNVIDNKAGVKLEKGSRDVKVKLKK